MITPQSRHAGPMGAPLWLASAALMLMLAGPAAAEGRAGKLLLTGGLSSIDGAAGGGLTPWAVTGSHASEGQFGAT